MSKKDSHQKDAQKVQPPTPDEEVVPAATVGNDNELQERIEELTGDLQRLQAEFLNYKRREDGAKAELLEMAKREVITLLLPTLDNIERALAHRPAELADNAWALGVEQVGKQTTTALAKLGIERIETVGQPFDHNLHEAIAYEDGEGDHEVVVEELQPGYRMGDRIIRHAMVKVGKQ
jgi:molecular chaperone GrpE